MRKIKYWFFKCRWYDKIEICDLYDIFIRVSGPNSERTVLKSMYLLSLNCDHLYIVEDFNQIFIFLSYLCIDFSDPSYELFSETTIGPNQIYNVLFLSFKKQPNINQVGTVFFKITHECLWIKILNYIFHISFVCILHIAILLVLLSTCLVANISEKNRSEKS